MPSVMCTHRRLESAPASARSDRDLRCQHDEILHSQHEEILHSWLYKTLPVKILIRLCDLSRRLEHMYEGAFSDKRLM